MKRNILVTKIDGLIRYIMVNTPINRLPLYIVNEYPKSGGSWVSQMLSEYFQISFPRNQIPKFQSAIMHGHYKYSPLMKNVFWVIRDGRDIMVSSYYHSFFENELYNTRFVQRNKKNLPFSDFSDVEKNMPLFIKYRFETNSYPRFNWAEFVESWNQKDVAKIRYEKLLENAREELAGAIERVTGKNADRELLDTIVEKYSFERQSKRKRGEEIKNSFLRKGIAGDWKNVFSKEAREIFDFYAGEQLIKLGYEKNHSWVRSK